MTITIEEFPDGTGFRLMATKHGFTSPAGPRLLRGQPWPDVQFAHSSRAQAEKDRSALQEYLDRVHDKISKAKARKEGA